MKRTTLACAALSSGKFAAASEGPVEVKIGQGVLRGAAADGIAIFRGVPFAKPPVGPQRFRAPERPTGWAGVRDATAFAPEASQAGTLSQSEDCLYLNVWAPQSSGRHPVLVWVHGGAMVGGRSWDPTFDGTVFARDGIVCITVAYRLGVLGFLDVEPMLGASYAGSANNGVRDLVAALTWVRENVAAFGGDPDRVTLGGVSAGAKLCDLLLGIPSAAPLFHQVISESGGGERIWTRERAQEVSREFTAVWSAVPGNTPASLLTAQPSVLVGAQSRFIKQHQGRTPLRPEVDGGFIPEAPLTAIAAGAGRGKRLLIGTNRDESAAFFGPHPAAEMTAKDLANVSLSQFQAIDNAYRSAFPKMDPALRRVRTTTAEEYWLPTVRTAQAHVTGGGETFFYRLDFRGRGDYSELAPHASELRFVWDRVSFFAGLSAYRLSSLIHGAWSSFIRGEAPRAPGMPTWPCYTLGQQETMIFDETTRVENAPQGAELELWHDVLIPPPPPAAHAKKASPSRAKKGRRSVQG